eukprot:TRINITY_DN15252_c0_g1_i1.p1 TRINITY_DN15252_c0_g1~~TRINITY_DN15252_c0_g1_i1.p1  ORF type:complete len:272 (+),score=111.51 TRINITY_DN15252_c0_g1_i1:264-1079(+)
MLKHLEDTTTDYQDPLDAKHAVFTPPVDKKLEMHEMTKEFHSETKVEVQKIEKPMVVHEHIHNLEKEEIQEVIYREREQTEVVQMTQPLKELEVMDTLVKTVQLEPQYRPTVIQNAAPIPSNEVIPSRIVEDTLASSQRLEPITRETIKKTVFEEITKVISKDIIAPTLICETLPIYERIVEAPIYICKELPVEELGLLSRLPSSIESIEEFMSEKKVYIPGLPHANFAQEKETMTLLEEKFSVEFKKNLSLESKEKSENKTSSPLFVSAS